MVKARECTRITDGSLDQNKSGAREYIDDLRSMMKLVLEQSAFRNEIMNANNQNIDGMIANLKTIGCEDAEIFQIMESGKIVA